MKTEIHFPYGRQTLSLSFTEKDAVKVLCSSIESYRPERSPLELVREALENPIGSAPLKELAKGKNKVVLIASDHTRPVPSKLIVPEMLKEIRLGNPEADITILIATGCHRETTKEELIEKFGEELVAQEKIVIHDCDKKEDLVTIGTLPSGGRCEINRLAYEADLLVSEGFIEPHFFAGFSGGRKSVLPGIAGRETVLANHCSHFIAHPRARTGVLEGNPIHEDMIWAAQAAKLRFIVNVVLNGSKETIYAVAGDPLEAHKKGTDFLSSLCTVAPAPADIVISTNGGFPLDQNMYQAVKGMTAAEASLKPGGVMIMIAASSDGIGGEHFYRQIAEAQSLQERMDEFLSRSAEETRPDQWQSQIFIRILLQFPVIYLSQLEDQTVSDMHMIPAHSLEEALQKARELVSHQASITVIPDGVSVIVKQ